MEIAPESGTGFEAAEGHAEEAVAYLNTAQAALQLAESSVVGPRKREPHMDFYATTGLTPEQICYLGNYVLDLIADGDHGQATIKGSATSLQVTPELRQIVAVCGPINARAMTRPTSVSKAYTTALSGQMPTTVTSRAELDELLNDVDNTTIKEPNQVDWSIVMGLGLIHLARGLSYETNSPASRLHGQDPVEHAVLLTNAYLGTKQNMSALTDRLELLLYGRPARTPIEQAGIRLALQGMKISQEVRQRVDDNERSLTRLCASIITAALSGADEQTQRVIDRQPTTHDVATSGPIRAEVLEAELRLIGTSATIGSRLREIGAGVQRLGVELISTPVIQALNSLEFPIPRSPLARELQRRSASQIAGAAAAKEAAATETLNRLKAELTALRGKYLLTKSAIKKHDGSTHLNTLLTKGDSDNVHWEGTLLPTTTTDTIAPIYTTLGLVYSLNELLDDQENSEAFGTLFEDIEKETTLVQEIRERQTTHNLSAPTEWLIANLAHLRTSPVEILKRIGNGLAAYNLARAASGGSGHRPMRKISVETLHRIEKLRGEAVPLDVRAFPPGPSLREELVDDARTFTHRSREQTQALEEERLLILADLSDFFVGEHYEVEIFRMLPGSLKQRHPYYALVITVGEGKGTRKVIIAENPKKPNATYVFEEVNRDAATWQEIVQLNKQAVEELGGRGIDHHRTRKLDDHKELVKAEALWRMAAQVRT